jgi:hypothetical protein
MIKNLFKKGSFIIYRIHFKMVLKEKDRSSKKVHIIELAASLSVGNA